MLNNIVRIIFLSVLNNFKWGVYVFVFLCVFEYCFLWVLEDGIGIIGYCEMCYIGCEDLIWIV